MNVELGYISREGLHVLFSLFDLFYSIKIPALLCSSISLHRLLIWAGNYKTE